MRILVFHGDLTLPSGGSVNARDWALGLKARGHLMSVYSPRLGAVAEEVRRSGIPVVNEPAMIADAPDVIMGTGVNDMTTLVARFPRAAGVQVAQLYDHWTSSPSPLPQVVLHIAVDELNVEMLANEFGVQRERIRLVRNAVNLARIAPRATPLPPRPRRVLVFAKNQTDYLPAIEKACASRNIDVEAVGSWNGRPYQDALQIIRDYDLVVGSARTALEGAACGAAVIVGDGRGLAGLLTTSNFDLFRRHNFGREVLTRPLTVEVIGQEIDRYDPDDSGKVTSLVRASASLDHQLEQIEAVLKEAIERVAHARPSEEDINRALSAYLAKHLPRASEGEPSPRHRQLESSNFTHLQKQMSAVVQKQEELEHRLTPLFSLTARLRTIARLLRRLAMLGGKRAAATNSATIANNSQRP